MDKEDSILPNIGPKQTQLVIMDLKIPDNLGLELDFVTLLLFNMTVQAFQLQIHSQSFKELPSLYLQLPRLYLIDLAELMDLLLKL